MSHIDSLVVMISHNYCTDLTRAAINPHEEKSRLGKSGGRFDDMLVVVVERQDDWSAEILL